MKVQMRFQKIVCILTIISTASAFILALGILTDIYYTMFLSDWGLDVTLFNDMQPFNRKLVTLFAVAIVMSLGLLFTMTNKRRKYYISNYVMIGIYSIYTLFISVWSIINILKFRQMFLTEIDFEMWAKIHEMIDKIKYTESTLWLDLNIATSVFVIIINLLLVGNLIWKIILMKKENELLSSENINIIPTEVE